MQRRAKCWPDRLTEPHLWSLVWHTWIILLPFSTNTVPACLDKVNLSPGVHLLWYLLDNRCASKQPGRDEEQLQEEIIYYTIWCRTGWGAIKCKWTRNADRSLEEELYNAINWLEFLLRLITLFARMHLCLLLLLLALLANESRFSFRLPSAD